MSKLKESIKNFFKTKKQKHKEFLLAEIERGNYLKFENVDTRFKDN